MPRLIVKQKAEVIQELVLKGSQMSYTIGTEPDNDLVLTSKKISMHHARIDHRGDQFELYDLKSAFGTYLNGKKVEERVELKSGDQIAIGEYTIVFDNPLEDMGTSGETSAGAAQDFSAPKTDAEFGTEEEVFVEVLEQPEPTQEQPVTAASANGKDQMAPYYLLAIYGPYLGKRYQLRYGETKIGRDVKLNDIVIRQNKRGEVDPSISRRHATIMHDGASFYVSDKRSKTRTYVNQTLVPEDTEVQLFPGDEIEIVSDQCSTIFRFVAEGNWDFSSPKRAGVWTIRYRSKFLMAAAAFSLVVGMFLLVNGYLDYSLLSQKPEQVVFELEKWRPYASSNRRAAAVDAGTHSGSSHLALADFDGDGVVDLAGLNPENQLSLIGGKEKKLKWTFSLYAAAPSSALTAADLNGNGLADLVMVTRDGKLISVDGMLGAEIWESPYFQMPLIGPPVIADFNGDGQLDVAIAEPTGKMFVGYAQIVNIQWETVNLGLKLQAPLSAADLNGDGRAEILSPTDRGLILIVDGFTLKLAGSVDINNELTKSRGGAYEENLIRFPTGVADFNGDGGLDLAISSVQGNVIIIDGATRDRLWDDRLVQGLSLNTEFPYPFAIGQFSEAGGRDLVVATEDGGLVAYLGAGDGYGGKTILWKFQPTDASTRVAHIALADINKDRLHDIVVVDEIGQLRVLNGQDGSVLWQTSQPITERTGSALIADLDHDSTLDIVLASESGSIYQYKSNSKIPYSVVPWGLPLGSELNTLTAGYMVPRTTGPTGFIISGILLIFGTLTTAVILKWRRKRFV